MNNRIPMPLVIAAISIGGFVASDIYLPSFLSLRAHYHVSAGHIQLTMTLFILFLSISQFVSGILSDRFGRKPVLYVGLSIFILGSLLTLLPLSINYLYLARSLQGIGMGACAVLSRIITRDLYEGKNLARIFAIIAVLIVMAPAVAPFIGGFLQAHFDYHGSFVAMLLYGVLLLLLVKTCLPETMANGEKVSLSVSALKSHLYSFLQEPRYIFSVLTNGVVFSLVIVYSMVLPFVFQHGYGLSPEHFGYLILMIASGMVVGMLSNIILLKHLASSVMVVSGLVISTVTSVMLLLLSIFGLVSVLSISITLFVLNVGVAMVMPNMAGKIFSVFAGMTGLVGAFYGAVRMLVTALFGGVITIFHMTDMLQLSVMLLVIASLSVLAYWGSCQVKRV